MMADNRFAHPSCLSPVNRVYPKDFPGRFHRLDVEIDEVASQNIVRVDCDQEIQLDEKLMISGKYS